MNNNYSKFKKSKLILGISLISLVLFLIYFFIFKDRSPKVVNTQKTPPSLFNPDEIIPVDVDPISSTSGFDQGNIFGINRKDGTLINFKNDIQTVIYSGKVHDYYVKENIALVLDESDLSKIIVINLNTKFKREISLKSISPIISLTLSDDLKTIYFLSEFSINTKLPSLNSVSINGGSPSKLTETRAQSVRYLKKNILLLFEENHAQDKNVLHFFNTNIKSGVLSKTTSSFQVSPDKGNVLLQTTNKVEIVDTNSFESKSKITETSSRSVWKDNNTVVTFRNDDKGLNYSVLTLDPFEISPFSPLVEKIFIQVAYGFINDILYWQGYNESIYQTVIETN